MMELYLNIGGEGINEVLTFLPPQNTSRSHIEMKVERLELQ